MSMHPRTPGFPPSEPESLSQLLGDCALMAPHWITTAPGPGPTGRDGLPPAAAKPAGPCGVRVPERSARLLDGMSDYGD